MTTAGNFWAGNDRAEVFGAARERAAVLAFGCFTSAANFSSGSSLPDSTGLGISATTSLAGLSRRKPLKEACRIIPVAVHPANSISATRLGLSHRMLRSCSGAFAPAKGLTFRVSFLSCGNNFDATAAPKPVPMRPT